MEILALLGVGALVRALRRSSKRDATASPYTVDPFVAPINSPGRMGPRLALVLRAGHGLLLAALRLLFALLPWPTAWATSAALAPTIDIWRRAVLAKIDVITAALVGLALIEPLVLPIIRALTYVPRLLFLLTQLAWVQLRVLHWRFCNWRCALLRRHQC
jgi:hypothetical protein